MATLGFMNGLLAALYERERSGVGQKVAVNHYQVGTYINGALIQGRLAGANVIKHLPNRESPLRSFYECSDGLIFVATIVYFARKKLGLPIASLAGQIAKVGSSEFTPVLPESYRRDEVGDLARVGERNGRAVDAHVTVSGGFENAQRRAGIEHGEHDHHDCRSGHGGRCPAPPAHTGATGTLGRAALRLTLGVDLTGDERRA